MEQLPTFFEILYSKPFWIFFGVLNFIAHFWFTHGMHDLEDATMEDFVPAVIMSFMAAAFGALATIPLLLTIALVTLHQRKLT